jgi:hypothetical protein
VDLSKEGGKSKKELLKRAMTGVAPPQTVKASKSKASQLLALEKTRSTPVQSIPQPKLSN